MPCTYCNTNVDHKSVTACPFNVMDRAVTIFNDSLDPHLSNDGRTIARTAVHHINARAEWFKDQHGRGPSHADWNLLDTYTSMGGYSLYHFINPRYRRIVELLWEFHHLKFDMIPLTDARHIGFHLCSTTKKKNEINPTARKFKYLNGIISFETITGDDAILATIAFKRWSKMRASIMSVRYREYYIVRNPHHHISRAPVPPRPRGGPGPRILPRPVISTGTFQQQQQQRHIDFAQQQQHAQEMRENGFPQPSRTEPTDSLPPSVQHPIKTEECSICMEVLGKVNCVTVRCGHQFCGDCIFTHLQMAKGTNCPMCRTEYAVRPKNYIPAQRHTVGQPVMSRPAPPPVDRELRHIGEPHWLPTAPRTHRAHEFTTEINDTITGLTPTQFEIIVSVLTNST